MAARNFDEVILDDFFFYTSKSDADIAAKGARSWTQYRLDKMREVARTLVLGPARAAHPNVRMVIKYPNWYEHFQGLGYDLDQESHAFEGIYTGTETRDPEITDQLLQQYESYLIIRYFNNIRPDGANGGGWVDTFGTRYVDRYAEQLWDTLFAKAPEITLFNWAPLAEPNTLSPGDRSAWSGQHTSFDWDAVTRSMEGRKSEGGAGWARAAGYSLEQVDQVLGLLGNPLGIASYKPYQSSSAEDFLQEYLGNLGIPIELTPRFPAEADLMLLTESAKFDPDLVTKIKGQLTAGKSVIITSGLLHALQDHGIRDIAEWEYTGHQIAVHDYFEGYGAGNGTRLNDPGAGRDILFPEIHFYTNDSWSLLRGVASLRGIPLLLMNRYSKGVLYVLDIPDNIGDLYGLPQPALAVIRTYLQGKFPVRLDAPPQVSLFAYDNGTFVVESFRPTATTVNVLVAGTHKKLTDLLSKEETTASGDATVNLEARTQAQRRDPEGDVRSSFAVQIPPHSYRVFRAD